MKTPTLRQLTPTLFAWRDWELSNIGNTHPRWNLCRAGTNKYLPDGVESIEFCSLIDAAAYLKRFGKQLDPAFLGALPNKEKDEITAIGDAFRRASKNYWEQYRQ